MGSKYTFSHTQHKVNVWAGMVVVLGPHTVNHFKWLLDRAGSWLHQTNWYLTKSQLIVCLHSCSVSKPTTPAINLILYSFQLLRETAQ